MARGLKLLAEEGTAMPDQLTPDEPTARPYADELSAAVAEDFQSFASSRAARTAEQEADKTAEAALGRPARACPARGC